MTNQMSPGAEPLREQIATAASLIDIEKVRSAPPSEDPMVELLRREIDEGTSAEEAVTSVIDRVTAVGQQVLSMLDYAPNATMGYSLGKQLEDTGVTELEADAAIQSLGRRGRTDAINDWFVKKPEPIQIERDDLDWLLGTGRFAQ